MESLPLELLDQIVCHLGCRDIARLAAVSRSMADACRNRERLVNSRNSVKGLIETMQQIVKHEIMRFSGRTYRNQSRLVVVTFNNGTIMFFCARIKEAAKEGGGLVEACHEILVERPRKAGGAKMVAWEGITNALEFREYFDCHKKWQPVGMGIKKLYDMCDETVDGKLGLCNVDGCVAHAHDFEQMHKSLWRLVSELRARHRVGF